MILATVEVENIRESFINLLYNCYKKQFPRKVIENGVR